MHTQSHANKTGSTSSTHYRKYEMPRIFFFTTFFPHSDYRNKIKFITRNTNFMGKICNLKKKTQGRNLKLNQYFVIAFIQRHKIN